MLDALLRVVGMNFFDGMAAMSPASTRGCRLIWRMTTSRNSWREAERLERVAIRHTVGLDDAIEGKGGVADISENGGARYFKLKLNGDPEHDAARLIRIGKELGDAASMTTASRSTPTSNMPISLAWARWSTGSIATAR